MFYRIRKLIGKPIIKVLLVDDDDEDYLFLKKALQYQVFKTTLQVITTSENVLERLNDKKLQLPDVIFLDINMPEKDGYTLLVDIKEVKRLQNIPVVIYSSSFQRDVADMLFEIGANYYIKKPTEFKDVKRMIEKVLCFISENEHY